ncbi:Shikimate 5-dehydrogenase [Paramicrobacterium humi]|uniref:Shikimate 5-dehydrogenase n=1 Tax=Paramicrobacterium humi TaxID=640635 RepID=A0A1H4LYK2_9MICO|nr:saccharopine dehydrogenase NADP-binding domain-containing protein [Microbacterium humi]SEB75859.1 Shikimate 5-dehydrogenase [Microbacterium humi]
MTTETATGYMGFVGVSTAQSSIMRVFPAWAEILGLPTRTLVGHDLPMDARPEQYVALVEQIRDDPQHLGALVTTHKMALYAAAAPLFDRIDDFGSACGEISSISKRDGQLIGHAKDPITAGLAVEDFLPDDHFAETGAEVLILGAGGAGSALSWYLAEREDRPRRITVTDASDARLDHLRSVHAKRATPQELIRYVAASDEATRALLADLPAGSLVVNATGLGKDRPGTPLPHGAELPHGAFVWEFNYRGSLEFLAQAREQEADRDLIVIDGWRYFIHGWSQVIAEVFGLTLTDELVERLADAAAAVR